MCWLTQPGAEAGLNWSQGSCFKELLTGARPAAPYPPTEITPNKRQQPPSPLPNPKAPHCEITYLHLIRLCSKNTLVRILETIQYLLKCSFSGKWNFLLQGLLSYLLTRRIERGGLLSNWNLTKLWIVYLEWKPLKAWYSSSWFFQSSMLLQLKRTIQLTNGSFFYS